jgi:hypothetical protein
MGMDDQLFMSALRLFKQDVGNKMPGFQSRWLGLQPETQHLILRIFLKRKSGYREDLFLMTFNIQHHAKEAIFLTPFISYFICGLQKK